MKYFVPIGIVLTIVVTIMATYLKKKYPTKKVYMLPGGILTVISLIIVRSYNIDKYCRITSSIHD